MKTVLLVSHISETPGGPLEKFYQYLRKRYTVYRILHPLTLKTKQKSSIHFGKETFSFKIPPLLQYPFESLYVLIYWYRGFKTFPKIDLAICFDSLAYFHTFLFKKILRIDKIIYYNVDYSKKRFSNAFMNTMYQVITRFSYMTCDYFFAFENKFVEEVDPHGKYAYKQSVIPPLINFKSIQRTTKKIPRSLVYIGAIDYATTDVKPMLEALKRLKEEKVNFNLYIYSRVDPTSPIHNLIRKFYLSANIIFCGIVDNETLSKKLLPKYKIGVAPYARQSNSRTPDHAFMNKNLTGRLVEYIGAGLPIVSTRITDAFRLIDNQRIGFSVVNSQDWYDAIKILLTDQALYKSFSKNALTFAKNYDADKVLTPAFKKLYKEMGQLEKNEQK